VAVQVEVEKVSSFLETAQPKKSLQIRGVNSPLTQETQMNERACQATHEEICDKALRHYEKLASEVSCWNSLIPRAIKFYRKYGKSK